MRRANKIPKVRSSPPQGRCCFLATGSGPVVVGDLDRSFLQASALPFCLGRGLDHSLQPVSLVSYLVCQDEANSRAYWKSSPTVKAWPRVDLEESEPERRGGNHFLKLIMGCQGLPLQLDLSW